MHTHTITKLLSLILVGLFLPIVPCFADSLDSLLNEWKSVKITQSNQQADLLVNLSWEYRRKSADSTIFFAQQALLITRKNDYKSGTAQALKNIGIGYSIKGQPDSAFHYMEASLATAKELGDPFLIGRNLNNLGLTHHRQGNYEVALDYYLKSLQISEKIGDATSGVTLMNIGLLEQKTEDYDNALIHFRQALTYAEQENNQHRIASCLYNIGSIHLQREKFNLARTYYSRALKYSEEKEDYLLSGKILLSLGRILRKEERDKEAVDFFKRAEVAATKSRDSETNAQILSELAVLDFSDKKYAASLQKSKSAMRIAQDIKAKEIIKDLLHLQSENYAALGQYKAAFTKNKAFSEISDEIFNREKARKINALQISRTIQEKENQVLQLQTQTLENESTIKLQKSRLSIFILLFILTCVILAFLYSINKNTREKNKSLEERVIIRTRELESANLDLRSSNEELERFAFITSHDLKEPLRNISGFTGLLKRRLKNSLDEESLTYIQFVQKNTAQMHQLIEDVLEYSRIGKQEENISLVNTNETLKKVRYTLSTLTQEKNAEILAADLPIIEGVEPHIYLILKNLIENGLKYNDSPVPKIEIRVNKQAGYWTFSVKDNGIGVEREFLDQIFTMFKRLHNRDDHSGSGLGLALVKKVVEKGGGRIWVESTPKVGSTFFFTVPKDAPRKHSQRRSVLQEMN